MSMRSDVLPDSVFVGFRLLDFLNPFGLCLRFKCDTILSSALKSFSRRRSITAAEMVPFLLRAVVFFFCTQVDDDSSLIAFSKASRVLCTRMCSSNTKRNASPVFSGDGTGSLVSLPSAPLLSCDCNSFRETTREKYRARREPQLVSREEQIFLAFRLSFASAPKTRCCFVWGFLSFAFRMFSQRSFRGHLCE